jgi:hypothetical protein
MRDRRGQWHLRCRELVQPHRTQQRTTHQAHCERPDNPGRVRRGARWRAGDSPATGGTRVARARRRRRGDRADRHVPFSAKVGKRIRRGAKTVGKGRRDGSLHGPATCQISQYAFRRSRADIPGFCGSPATSPAEVNRHRIFPERQQVFTATTVSRAGPFGPAGGTLSTHALPPVD